jgi:hypothetical protein
MAEATRYAKVIVSSTNGDTVTGPLEILGFKFVNGANSTTCTFKDAAGNVLWSSGVVAANGNTPLDAFAEKWAVRAQAYTVALSATGGSLYIYLA